LNSSAREGRGSVVLNVSSDAAVNPYAQWGAYGASKAALHHMSRIWNEELAAEGVRFLTLDPGDMDTPVYWYGKSKVASLFGSGPINGCDAFQTLAWIYRGGGLELYQELLAKLGLNVVGFAMPMPTQPLGWFRKPITEASQLKGLKYRTVGLAADLFQSMGAKVTQLPGGEIVPALERGVIDAFEFNNPTSDMRFGAQDVIKNYEMGSFHQAMEFFEIIINKKKPFKTSCRSPMTAFDPEAVIAD
jgi:TRAP-type mannitol/chloroaromatic compound transport system substrate-binding protein